MEIAEGNFRVKHRPVVEIGQGKQPIVLFSTETWTIGLEMYRFEA